MKRLAILIAVVLILIPTAFWWLSSGQVIKRRTNHLLDVISLSEDSHRGLRQTKVYSLNAILADNIELLAPDIPEADGGYSKSQIENGFSWLCSNARKALFTDRDFRSIQVEGDTAKVELRLEAFVELPASHPADGIYDLSLEWRKTDNKWLLDRAAWSLLSPGTP